MNTKPSTPSKYNKEDVLTTSIQGIIHDGNNPRIYAWIFYLSKKTNLLFLINVICVIAGGIVRIAYCFNYPVPVRDSYVYYDLIEKWNRTGEIPLDKVIPPLGLYLLRMPCHLLFCDIIKGSICINIILSLSTIVVFIVLSSKILKSNALLLLCGIMFASHPRLVQYSCQATRETSYLFFTCNALFIILYYVKTCRVWYLVLSGVLACCAIMCRYEGFESFVICFFCILLAQNTKLSIKRRLQNCGIFILSYIACFFLIMRMFDISPMFYHHVLWVAMRTTTL